MENPNELPLLRPCPECHDVMEKWCELIEMMSEKHNVHFADDDGKPLKSVNICCPICAGTGHMLTSAGDVLVSVLMRRIKSLKKGETDDIPF